MKPLVELKVLAHQPRPPAGRPSKALRSGGLLAHEREQTFVNEQVMLDEALQLVRPSTSTPGHAR